MEIVFNIAKLMTLLKYFNTLTGFRVGVFDIFTNEIAAYPKEHSSFCKIIRSCDKALCCCRESDKKAFDKAISHNDVYIYRCHAGLMEAVAAIVDRQKVVGFLVVGQMRSDEDRCFNVNSVKPYFTDNEMEALSHAYDRLQTVKNDVVIASANILKACAVSIWLENYILIQNEDLAKKFESYVISNLTDDLSLNTLTEKLSVGKTKLCSCVKERYSMPPGDFIKKCRIEKAKEMLINTSLPISDIANAVGIPDYNYFTKVFKNVTELTPRDFRKAKSIT